MIYLSQSGDWFNIPSIVIDLFSFLVLFLISMTSLKYYKLNKNKKYLYLGGAFLLICSSFLFKLFTNLTVYYKGLVETSARTAVIVTLEAIRSYNIFSDLTFTLFTFLNLMGLYMLYSIYQQKQSRSSIVLISYFILISTYISNSNYYIFHLTSLIFLTAITSLYFSKHKSNGYINTKVLAYSFGVIAISQLLFMFTSISPLFYMMGEIIQLGGYALLFLIFRRVTKNG
jgi:hypothetical protein